MKANRNIARSRRRPRSGRSRTGDAMRVGDAEMRRSYRQRFTYSTYVSVTTTVGNFALTPTTFDSRLSAISDQYQYFRFTKMFVTAHPYQSVLSGTFIENAMAWAFQPGGINTTPSTFADLTTMEHVLIQTAQATVPRSLAMSRELRHDAARSWWKCRPGSSTEEEVFLQGRIWFAADAATSGSEALVQFTYEVEFCGPLAAGLTLARVVPSGHVVERKEGRNIESKASSEVDGSGTGQLSMLPLVRAPSSLLEEYAPAIPPPNRRGPVACNWVRVGTPRALQEK